MSAPTIYRLLSIYWDRHDLLVSAMRKTDAAEGDAARAKADAAQSRAGDRLQEALIDICAYLPTWKYEARLKRDFLATYIQQSGTYLERAAMDALLESIGKLALPSQEGGAS